MVSFIMAASTEGMIAIINIKKMGNIFKNLIF